MQTPPSKYRQDIDGLRAIAVLLVLIFHFSLLPLVTAGFTGVDVFFVISGFLITGILKRQLDEGNFGFRDFYVARVRRLAPALVTTLLVTLCAGMVLLFPDDLRELATQMLVSQAYVANIYFWRTVNYFGLNGANVFLLHTWSLAVEEQFYLFYPVVCYILHRAGRRLFWPGVALLAVLSFGLNLYFVGTKPEAVFYLLPTRAWELLAGAMTLLAANSCSVPRGGKQFLGLAGLVLIVAGALCYRPGYRFPGLFAVVPVLGSGLVLFAHDPRGTAASGILEWRPLRYLGRISYPLYLVHWPLHVFATRMLGDDYTYASHLAMFLLSVGLAAVIYHFVELPLRSSRWLARRSALLGGYAVVLAGTLLGFCVVKATAGLPGRFPAQVVRLASFTDDKSPPLTECEFNAHPAALELGKLCKMGDSSVSPRWIILGDSHAWATHDAFDFWLKRRSEAAVFIFRHGCAPLADVHFFGDDGTCFRFNRAAVEFIRMTPSIDHVALVSTWRQGREQIISTDERLQPSDAQSRALFASGFASMTRRLADAGKQVYVWEPLPGARASVPESMARARLRGVAANVDKSRAEYLDEYAFFFGDLAADRAQIAGTFSPSAALCASGTCVTSLDGSPLYFDNSHPTRSSAAYFAAAVLGRSLIK